ncbi:hypothetical protein [Labilibaculum euxinus]
MEQLYKKGFLSFRPVLDLNNQLSIDAYLERKNSRVGLQNVFHVENSLKSLNDDELEEKMEEIIADSEFASLLNENGEIQVGDSLYKYTDSGLYFVHINDEDHLNRYLEENRSQLGLGTKSKSQLKLMRRVDELVDIDEKITRYRVIEDEPREPIAYTGGSSSNYVLSKLPAEFKNFEITNGRQTFFGGVFGKRRASHVYFSSHRRAKILYFNQKYLLASRLGIEVKYQKKGTGIWSAYKADELAIGINQAFFALDYKTSQMPSIPKCVIKYDGKAYSDNYQIIPQNHDSNAPNWPFKDSEISISLNVPMYGWVEENYTPEQMNNMLWGYAYSYAEGLMTKLQKPMPEKISMVGVSSSMIYINYMDVAYRDTHTRKIKRIFNQEFQTPKVVLGFTNNGAVEFKEISGLPDLMSAKTINLDFYGGARRGTKWMGKRMIFAD